MTSSHVPFLIPDAHRRFFASRDEYLAFRAAWRALTASPVKPSAALHAARAVLTGRDLYRAFSPNRRRAEPAPFCALVRALALVPHLGTSRYWRAQLAQALPAHHIQALLGALERAGVAVQALGLRDPAAREAIARGAGDFAAGAPALPA